MSWTVTFESNLGTPVAPQTLETGDLVTAPANVTKENYVLLGWFKDAAFAEEWDFTTDTVTEDVTLYAKWRLKLAARLRQILFGLKAEIDTKIPLAEKGQPEGVATLDENGKIPVGQINDAFNEVLQASSVSNFPSTGEAAKLYIAEDTKKVYRWDGTAYRVASNQTFLQSSQPDYMIEGDLWLSQD